MVFLLAIKIWLHPAEGRADPFPLLNAESPLRGCCNPPMCSNFDTSQEQKKQKPVEIIVRSQRASKNWLRSPGQKVPLLSS